MLCQKCQSRPATVHVVRVVNQEKEEEYLCEICAAEKGHFQLSPANTLQNFFPQLAQLWAPAGMMEPTVGPSCPLCGMTLRELSQTGRPGCPQCYEAFGSQLRPLLARIHGNPQHRGLRPGEAAAPTPVAAPPLTEAERRLQGLRQKMQGLVTEERFEEAAALRDEIRRLEEEKAGDGHEQQ